MKFWIDTENRCTKNPNRPCLLETERQVYWVVECNMEPEILLSVVKQPIKDSKEK